MRRALVAFTVMVVAAAVAAPPATGNERFLRGVHQGRAYRLYLLEAVTPARPLVVARGSHTYPPGPDATDAMLRFLVA